MLTARSCAGLLNGVVGEDAKNGRVPGVEAHPKDAFARRVADVVEMGCFAADDGANGDHRVAGLVGFHEPLGAEGELKSSGHFVDERVVGRDACSAQHLKGSVAQGMGDLGVPRGNNNAHSIAGTVGQLSCVVQT